MVPRFHRRGARLVRFHSRRWQQRLIFVAGGVAVGFVAVGIAPEARRRAMTRSPWAPARRQPATAIAIGLSSVASNLNSVAVGDGAKATNDDATAIGDSSEASGSDSTAVGQAASATSASSTAVGQGASVSGGGSSTAVGKGATATNSTRSTVNGAFSSADDSVDSSVFGSNSFADGATSSTAAGAFSNVSGTIGGSAYGYNSVVAAGTTGGTASGYNSFAGANNASSYGSGSNATGVGSIAVGNSDATATNAIAVGTGAQANGNNTTAIGNNANATPIGSAAYGNGAVATLYDQQVFGTNSNTYTMPGITSNLSQQRQSGPLQLATTDINGNLASDNGDTFKAVSRLQAGVAVAMAAETPQITSSQNFGMRVGWGNYLNEANGVAASAIGVVCRGCFSNGDRIAVDGAVGAGWSSYKTYDSGNVVAGRAGLSWGW